MGMTDWLLKPLAWWFARRPGWRDRSGRLVLRAGRHFYGLLAVVFALTGAWDLFGHALNSQLSYASFDWLMRERPVPYRADPNIIVVDIDEASLAALAPRYGRWPWPREVLAEVATKLEAASPQAVMFDILFSDPDVANPASEAAFDRYVAASRKSYYPAVRLNPQNDSHSEITLAMLKFAERDPLVPAAATNGNRTVALVPPYYKSIYDSARVGTNNIYPDADNVVRWYPNFEPLAGYRIPSLPYRMAQELSWRLPAQSRSLINWPRGTAPYRTVEFAEAYRAAEKGDEAFFTQFASKIVLIGSTAPILNDIKATPVDRLHPGIFVLATAIDNTKHARFLRPLDPVWMWGIEILMLAGSARLFSRTKQALALTKYFFIIPGVLLSVSLLSVSISDLLVDLSVPIAIVLGYFTIAKLFDTLYRNFLSGTGPFAANRQEKATGQLQIACLPATVPRERILRLLLDRGSPIKLWEPTDTGIGELWAGQGWVLWRWLTPEAKGLTSGPAVAAPELDLNWLDVPIIDSQADSFVLAKAIVAAAAPRAAR
ncbi:MAG TPA: CHASE2 domain-containing protein [Steroidobacteraceae bacterium]